MGLLEKILTVALGVSLLFGGGAVWYADHARQQLEPMRLKIADAAQAASQASADRDAAIQAAAVAQAQLKAAQDAFAQAASAAAAASATAASAHAKLQAAANSPDVSKLLTTPVPNAVWDAIYNPTGK